MLPLRAQVVEQTQLEYNAMLIGAFELLQSRQQQVEAGAQYIEAVRDYWLARTALDTLMAGRLRGSALEGRASPMSGISAGGAETAGDDH